MHLAVQKGQADMVDLLLRRGVDVNAENSLGFPALYYINDSQGDSVRDDIFELMINNGAHLTVQQACQVVSLYLAQKAIRSGSDVNGQDEDSRQTGLHHAAGAGSLPIINLLLTQAAHVNVRDIYGKTALFYAVHNGHVNVVQSLMCSGSDPVLLDTDGKTAMFYAFKPKDADMVETLANLVDLVTANTLSQDDNNRVLLHLATGAGCNVAVDTLVARGAIVNCKDKYGCTPLHEAIAKRLPSTAQLLLSKGADLHCRADRLASDDEDDEDEDEYDDDVREGGFTPLHIAAFHCKDKNIECLELLIAAGSNVDEKCSGGRTALHFAIMAGSKNAVAFLLLKGADAGCPDVSGRTPLMEAATRGYCSIIELLLDRHVNCDARDNCDSTALHDAARTGWHRAVRLLIPSSDLFALDDQSYLPYESAKYEEYTKAATMLRLAMDTSCRHHLRSYSFSWGDTLSNRHKLPPSSEILSRRRRHSWGSRTGLIEMPPRDPITSVLKAKRIRFQEAELRRREREKWPCSYISSRLAKAMEKGETSDCENEADSLVIV